MEESSNGKVEEILKEESWGKEKEDVVNDDSGAVAVKVVDGKSESLDDNNHDGGDSSSSTNSDEEAEVKERGHQVVDSGEFEEEEVVAVSVIDLVKHGVPQSEEFNVDEEVSAVQTKEVPEDVTKGTDEEVSNGTSGVSKEVSNGTSKVKEEPILPPSDWNDGVSEVASKVIEEIKLPPPEDGGEAPVPVAITEEEPKVIEASKQNTGESSHAVDVESKEKVEESLANPGNVESTADANEIASKPEISESNENQPIISLSQRTGRPTSWRSCCGLFEVLRRSDR